ncbi:MAG: TetR/AcrR family transcriptional regulator [Chloroflexaceae bacterium]|nr:TetR/AcrR family transcriptional regulator [Chloroflexaceae bacterium]
MSRPRNIAINAATTAQIKAAARQLMAQHGTAGLSLRAIARQLDLSPAALYHYFPSLNELITALIVDAFNGHAQAVRSARDAAAAQGHDLPTQLIAAALAYRAWACANPTDFQLVYGNPIPSYTAPAHVTTPAAQAVGAPFLETITAALAQGVLHVPASHTAVPAGVQQHYRAYLASDDPLQIAALHLLNSAWVLLHGMVVLELYQHLPPVVGDLESFYQHQLRAFLRQAGYPPPTPSYT